MFNTKLKKEISILRDRLNDLEKQLFVEDYFTKERILKANAVVFTGKLLDYGYTHYKSLHTTKENAETYKSAIKKWEDEYKKSM